jgi:hypothetical protein
MSFSIEPRTLYSMKEIKANLGGMISINQFLARTRLRSNRKFRDMLFGSEIIEAIEIMSSYTSPLNPDVNIYDMVDNLSKENKKTEYPKRFRGA